MDLILLCETGAGYSDNPLYGPFVREDAPYLESSIEAFFLKMEEVVHSVIFIYLGKERFSKDFRIQDKFNSFGTIRSFHQSLSIGCNLWNSFQAHLL